jgi:hypothetical protein
MLKLIPMVKLTLPDLKSVHYVTDSPASQYRNKSIVHIVGKHEVLFGGIKAAWNFLESGHGKGPCDGVGGSLKKSADVAVKSGKIIRGADEFYEWATNMESNIDFLYVSPMEIKQAERKLSGCSYVKGISQAHSLRTKEGHIWMRETSCYKACCRDEISCPGWENTGIEVQAMSEEQTELQTRQEQVGQVGRTGHPIPAGRTHDPEEFPEILYNVGMLVRAKYEGKLYVGKIQEYEPTVKEYLITFMTKEKGMRYRWPHDNEPEDVLWMPAKKIVEEVTLDKNGKIQTNACKCPSTNAEKRTTKRGRKVYRK